MKKRILYGIQCTGNGHISRSREIIQMLLKQHGDEIESIDVCLSGDLSQISIEDLNVVYKFPGLHMEMVNGKIGVWKTLKSVNLLEFFRSALSIDLSQYDIIVSDFEPVTCWAGLLRRRKVLGISNQYKFLSKKLLKSLSPNLFFNKTLTRVVCPVGDYISFDYLKEGERDFFPIIRESLRRVSLSKEDFYLVYLNTYPLEDLVKFFELFPHQQFYIFSKDCSEARDYENIKIRPIDKVHFTEKLLRCRGVITHTGFQTTSEALYLGKKLLVMPIEKQIEQIYNTRVLDKFGVVSVAKLEVGVFDDYFSNDYTVKLNYYDESQRICAKILNLDGKTKS
jgi:uncharacterized protein (TIGR00661 family)